MNRLRLLCWVTAILALTLCGRQELLRRKSRPRSPGRLQIQVEQRLPGADGYRQISGARSGLIPPRPMTVVYTTSRNCRSATMKSESKSRVLFGGVSGFRALVEPSCAD